MARPMLGLEFCRTIAASRGGWLVSTKYNGSRSPLQWKCGKGHQWTATLSNVNHRGSWCPFCAGNLQVAVDLAPSRGGVCLSDSYTNSKKPLHWRCAGGHAWWATLDAIKNAGSWCPQCACGKREGEVRAARLPQFTCDNFDNLLASFNPQLPCMVRLSHLIWHSNCSCSERADWDAQV